MPLPWTEIVLQPSIVARLTYDQCLAILDELGGRMSHTFREYVIARIGLFQLIAVCVSPTVPDDTSCMVTLNKQFEVVKQKLSGIDVLCTNQEITLPLPQPDEWYLEVEALKTFFDTARGQAKSNELDPRLEETFNNLRANFELGGLSERLEPMSGETIDIYNSILKFQNRRKAIPQNLIMELFRRAESEDDTLALTILKKLTEQGHAIL